MISAETISIAQYTPDCPKCAWKPASIEGSARYGELIDHVKTFHHMGAPTFQEQTIFVTGPGGQAYAQTCEVAIFTNL
jgi:hypothetical protein